MPDLSVFESEGRYYATLLHELVHWSGAVPRLNRDLSGRFGSKQYAAEELIAELGGIPVCPSRHHASFAMPTTSPVGSIYIASWLDLLTHDDRAVLTAASKASQAADFLRAFQRPVKQNP